jgi:hypothetical protein
MSIFDAIWGNAEKIGNLAQVGTFFVAIAALIFAYAQVTSAKKSQREATAKTVYHDFLKLAFENPKYAYPERGLLNDEKYRWFVAIVLNACDEIAWSVFPDHVWEAVVFEELKPHAEYLTSPQFKEDGEWRLYSPKLKNVWERFGQGH